MQSMSSKDKANLLAILDAIHKIEGYTKDIRTPKEFYQKDVVFDATLMNFVVIGEMVDRLSDEVKSRAQRVDWQKVKDFRNLVAHDYLGIDAEEVWQIVEEDLPVLKHSIEDLLKD